MTKKRRSNDATGMAGEFFVMEKLYRLGHQPSLTVGKAKSIDILVKTTESELKEISVKANCGGGKWPIGLSDNIHHPNFFYILLIYKDFEDPMTNPKVYIIPGKDAKKLKEPWFDGEALYYSNKERRKKLERFENAWDLLIRT